MKFFLRAYIDKTRPELNIAAFSICIIAAALLQDIRAKYFEVPELLKYVLGSAPSFFYVLGIISIIPVIERNLSLKRFIRLSGWFTLGACLFEASQLWTDSQFDFYDLFATVFAYALAVSLMYSYNLKNRDI